MIRPGSGWSIAATAGLALAACSAASTASQADASADGGARTVDVVAPADVVVDPSDRPPVPPRDAPAAARDAPDFTDDVPLATDLGVASDAPRAVGCDAAEDLPLDTGFNVDLTRSTSFAPACPASTAMLPPVRWYRTVLPPRAQLNVAVSAGSRAFAAVRFFDGCGALGCIAPGTVTDSPGSRLVTLPNDTDATRAVVLAVGLDAPDRDVPPAAVTATAYVRPLLSNGRCDTALPLADGAVRERQSIELLTAPTPACAATPDVTAPALWYRVDVPPRRTAVITSTVAPAPRPAVLALRLFADCAATACVGGGFGTVGSASNTVRWTNASDAAASVFVAAGSPFAGAATPFSLGVTIL